tara:strand:- start:606 stop:1244 length:639 start_codon:yes stop_codon:yes gene_type:complete
MITKGKLTDQILRLFSGGILSDDKDITRDDISLLVGQVINRLLKTEHLAVNMQSGEMFPPHTLVTTYIVNVSAPSVLVPYAHAPLPTFPISLPRNMGVWSVSDTSCSNEYIPIQTGQYSLVNQQDQLKFLETHSGYWAEGTSIYFTRDITASPYNVKKVRVQLLIVDPSILGEYDYLAIPAEMEEAVVKEVLTLIGALPKQVDKASDSNSQI